MRVGSGIGPLHDGAGALGRVHDFVGGAIQHFVIEGFHADADAFV